MSAPAKAVPISSLTLSSRNWCVTGTVSKSRRAGISANQRRTRWKEFFLQDDDNGPDIRVAAFDAASDAAEAVIRDGVLCRISSVHGAEVHERGPAVEIHVNHCDAIEVLRAAHEHDAGSPASRNRWIPPAVRAPTYDAPAMYTAAIAGHGSSPDRYLQSSLAPARHEGTPQPTPASVPVGPESRTYDVFISHAGPDKPFAIAIYNSLQSSGISAFLDKEEIPAGEPFSHEIATAAHSSKVGLFILSPEFYARKWTLRELSMFFDRRDSGARPQPKLIPVFYRWRPNDCVEEFYRRESAGNVFTRECFFDTAMQNEFPKHDVFCLMRRLHRFAGVALDPATPLMVKKGKVNGPVRAVSDKVVDVLREQLQ